LFNIAQFLLASSLLIGTRVLSADEHNLAESSLPTHAATLSAQEINSLRSERAELGAEISNLESLIHANSNVVRQKIREKAFRLKVINQELESVDKRDAIQLVLQAFEWVA
jgi:hypothetical protein